MTTSTTEDRTAHVTGAEKAKSGKKARVAARRAHVAPTKAKSGKKASPAKKALKTASRATPKPRAAREKAVKEKGVREGSKTETILLKRPDGVTLKELMKATGWQAHSVRGFLSGTIRKKLGLKITSTKAEDGERTYSLKT